MSEPIVTPVHYDNSLRTSQVFDVFHNNGNPDYKLKGEKQYKRYMRGNSSEMGDGFFNYLH